MSDQPREKPRGDQMTKDFFENVFEAYLEEDRIESAVLRLELDDGRTRRVVVDDDTESLSPQEYVERELDELAYLLEANADRFGEAIELSIPVADEQQVVEQARSGEAVTTLFKPEGVATVLEELRARIGEVEESPDADL
jgi:hypothetical protein